MRIGREMNPLSAIANYFRSRKAEDPVFGALFFFDGGRERTPYWEARCFFPPCGRTIDLSIAAESFEHRPTDEQKAFFAFVEANYEAICLKVKAAFDDDAHLGQRTDYTLVGFSIPPCRAEGEAWDMSFESDTGILCLSTAHLQGREARVLSVDFEID